MSAPEGKYSLATQLVRMSNPLVGPFAVSIGLGVRIPFGSGRLWR